jgi:peptidoglycan hydrolase-like protein with peptidoglycan-binding domain
VDPTIQIENFKIGNIISPNGLESIFSFTINKDSSPSSIKNLQEVLSKLEYYKGENTGKWSREISGALCEFQKDKAIVKTCSDFAAGYFGPKTRSSLTTAWNAYQTMIRANNLAKIEEQKKKEKIADNERDLMIEKGVAYAKTLKKAETTVQSFGSPKIGEIGPHVRKLQLALKDLGFYKEKDTAIFGEKTRKALLAYQQDRGIIESAKNEAGTIGKNTKTKLVEDLLALGDMSY